MLAGFSGSILTVLALWAAVPNEYRPWWASASYVTAIEQTVNAQGRLIFQLQVDNARRDVERAQVDLRADPDNAAAQRELERARADLDRAIKNLQRFDAASN